VQAVSSFDTTGNPYIDGLLMGKSWALPDTLTFSFPSDPSFYGTGYALNEPGKGFEALTALQQNAVRSVLNMYSSVANLTFTEVTETATQHGDIRYGETDATSTAWAYFPDTAAASGDVWFNNSRNYFDNPVPGNYAWHGMLHETGHALGLKHPHNSVGMFQPMPTDQDSIEYSVMSYRSFIGAGVSGYSNAADSYPQTLMMLDIAALQTIYGANYETNSGNTVYSWSPTTGQMYINGVAQLTPLGNRSS
jgi:serralysin